MRPPCAASKTPLMKWDDGASLRRNQKEEEQRKTEDKKDSRGGVMDGMGKRTRMRNSKRDIEDGEGL